MIWDGWSPPSIGPDPLMAAKKSLGSNPLLAKRSDGVLREMLNAPAPPKPESDSPPVALVLSGRGAEAAFEAGVLGGLASSNGFDAQILTGVSVGAMNAAVVAGHPGDLASAVARLRGIWLDELAGGGWTGRNGLYRSRGDLRAFLEPTRFPGAIADLVGDGSHWIRDAFRHGARLARSDEDLAPRLLWFADLSSMLSLDPFAALVSKTVDLQGVRASKRRLRIATAHWLTGRVDLCDGTELDDATGHQRIVAAAARPGIFPCVEINGSPHVEASAFLGSELGSAIEAGATRLHVPIILPSRAEGDRPASTIDALNHQLARLQLGRLELELKELRARRPQALTVHLYRGKPFASGSHGFLDLSRDRIAALIEHGREAALRHDCQAEGCLLSEG
jgi:predicted acylesterase/phospholipase RssA